jgi:Uma2 family endonuclease
MALLSRGADMATAVSRKTLLTAADLLKLIDRLGGIDPARVRLRPIPGTATEKDVLRAEREPQKALCELIDGTLVEKPMGYRESSLAMWIGARLQLFVEERELGIVAGADGFMRLAPRNVRIPDVSYVSYGRLPDPDAADVAIADFAPDLAVEVLSPSNTRREMERKRRDYFAAGTLLVWEIDPKKEIVEVYQAPDSVKRLTKADNLTGNSVLPGFKARVADLFARKGKRRT